MTLLDFLPDNARSHAKNLFLEVVRQEAVTEPTVICRRVMERIRDARYPAEPNTAPALLPNVMRGNRQAALDFATHCVEWERMTPAERERHRAPAVAEGKRRAMSAKPPTPAQLARLLSLGHTQPPANMLDASETIDRLLKRSPNV